MPDARSSHRPDGKARALLACCRPDGGDEGDKALRAALQQAESDPGLRRDFALQTELDGRVAALVRAVPLPPGLLQRAETDWSRARRRQFSWGQLFRHPAFLAALLAGMFLVAWTAWMVVAHFNGFSGDENVVNLIDHAWPAVPRANSAAAATPAAAAAPGPDGIPATIETLPQGRGWLAIQGPASVGMECGKLGDLLMLRHGIDRYRVPPELAGDTALAYRMLEQQGEQAVEIIVRPVAPAGGSDPSPGNLYFFSFRAASRGVSIEPAGRWKFLAGDTKPWAAAVQEIDGACFVVVCKGTKDDIRRRLTEAGVKY